MTQEKELEALAEVLKRHPQWGPPMRTTTSEKHAVKVAREIALQVGIAALMREMELHDAQ